MQYDIIVKQKQVNRKRGLACIRRVMKSLVYVSEVISLRQEDTIPIMKLWINSKQADR